ncbi:MAG: hypothetical protein U0930_14495 [Pirellulales bacterium]
MDQDFKGGNSRLLVRLFDQLDLPLAILDRQGEIVFVNRPLCQMAQADSTVLVGKKCSWQIAEDGPLAPILSAMAPPSSAMEGKGVVRRLVAPIVFGSTHTGQLFLPISDQAGDVFATLVMLGNVELLQRLIAPDQVQVARGQPDRVLVQIRSRWKTLDGLLALVGTSPAIQLAMERCQLVIFAM